jgi:hypothetical protein
LVSLIVVRGLAFRAVEWPELHVLCQTLNPEAKDFIVTAHSTVAKKIEDSWICHQDVVRRKLQSAISSIHIIVDIWTAAGGQLLLAIVAQFVPREDEILVRALIGLREVLGHSGEDQFTVLLPVLENYSIVRKVGALVGDNASTNDTFARQIQAHLAMKEDIE